MDKKYKFKKKFCYYIKRTYQTIRDFLIIVSEQEFHEELWNDIGPI